jgi:hypothetical protein
VAGLVPNGASAVLGASFPAPTLIGDQTVQGGAVLVFTP